MNRRDFILGGGIIGAITGLVKITEKNSVKPGNIIPCERDHEPDPNFIKNPAFVIATIGSKSSNMVPCVKCGQIFGIKYES